MLTRLLVRTFADVLLHALRGLRHLRAVVGLVLEGVGHLIADLTICLAYHVNYCVIVGAASDLPGHQEGTATPLENLLELVKVLITRHANRVGYCHGGMHSLRSRLLYHGRRKEIKGEAIK